MTSKHFWIGVPMTPTKSHVSSGKWIGTDLHTFLVRAFPSYVDQNGGLIVTGLAEDMGMSREGFCKWLRKGKLSKPGVEKLYAFAVKLHPDGAPKMEEFAKHLFA